MPRLIKFDDGRIEFEDWSDVKKRIVTAKI